MIQLLNLEEADMKYKDELIKAYGTALEVEVSDKDYDWWIYC